MEEYYGFNDWRDYSLSHSWGTKPEQKKREKEYNAEYYKKHKDQILKRRKQLVKNKKNRPVWDEYLESEKEKANKEPLKAHSPGEPYVEGLAEKWSGKSEKKKNKNNSPVSSITAFEKALKKSGYEPQNDGDTARLWKQFRSSLGYSNDFLVYDNKAEKKMKVKKTMKDRARGVANGITNLKNKIFHSEEFSDNDWRCYTDNQILTHSNLDDEPVVSYYGNNDWRDYSLQHSWGTKPEQKKREKEYNAWYWKTHKEEIMKKRGQRGNSESNKDTSSHDEKTNQSINQRDERGLLNPPEEFKSAIRDLYDFYSPGGKSNPYKGTRDPKTGERYADAYSDFNEFQVEMAENGYVFVNDGEARDAWSTFKKNIDAKYGKTKRADKEAPEGKKDAPKTKNINGVPHVYDEKEKKYRAIPG